MLKALGSAVYTFYNYHLAKRPLATKVATGVVGMILSDVIAQVAAWPRHSKHGQPKFAVPKEEAPRATYDFMRTVRLCTYSALVGTPLAHYWFALLDVKVMPGSSGTLYAALAKLTLDQLIMGPIGLFLFFAGMKILEGEPHLALTEARAKMGPALMMAYSVWPLANLINFLWVPPAQRILYCNFINVFFQAFLVSLHTKRPSHKASKLESKVSGQEPLMMALTPMSR